MRLREITEAVGRITKQNQTVDVGPDEVTKQAAKFGNSVDRDGRPPTLSKKVKGKSTNVLYNLGLAEGYKLQLERDREMLVLHIKDTETGKRTEVRGKPGYETDYDPNDKLHILLDKVGKSANISDLINGEVVSINPKHPDADRAKAATSTAFNECPRTKAASCQCESVNKITEAEDTVTAVCVLEQSDTVKGTILFKQTPGQSTLIVGEITGLEPGEHGFHIHEFGDLSKGCESAGGHYNPDGVDHGDLEQGHVGDLGNITADDSGTASFEIIAKRIDLMGERSVVGRSVVVHADQDDLGKGGDDESLKTGNAGDRLACGVITLKETIKENFTENKINFTMPNFNFEWEEANRYEQYRKIGKEEWIKLAKTGKVVDVDNRTANDIENTDAGEEYRDDHWDGLVQAKRDRFTQAISSGQIELPIIARYSDGQLELISGNTRLTGMMRELGKAKAWIYDVPDEIADLEENFADGKKKGKSRPGRVKRAGASCNGSVTDLRKRAKNASGEKAKMYHWCANMKSGRKKK